MNRKERPSIPKHTAQKNAVAKARKLVLQKRVLELRIQGLSERAIAEYLFEHKETPKKFNSGYIHDLLDQALDGILLPEAEKLKRLELERLDTVINGHYANAVNGDVAATHALLACVDRRNRLIGIGQERVQQTQQLGADGKPVDPVRPVINLTIAQVAPALTNGKAASPVIEHKPVVEPGD